MTTLGRSRPARRRMVVGAILACGGIAAAAIYATAPSPEDEDPALHELQHSREYERQVEVLGGKGTLLANQLEEWLASFWHGESLAYTVGVLSAIAALAYYAWDRLREEPPDDG